MRPGAGLGPRGNHRSGVDIAKEQSPHVISGGFEVNVFQCLNRVAARAGSARFSG